MNLALPLRFFGSHRVARSQRTTRLLVFLSLTFAAVFPAGAQVIPALPANPGAISGPAAPTPATPATQQGATPAANGNNTSSSDSTSDQETQNRNTAERRDRSSAAAQDVPTEFQRLVADSTGVNLPIFGQSLFANVPSTFAPVTNIPVSPDYLIGPGDQLRVQVYGQVNQQRNLVVDRNGDIAYPDVGDLHVAGLRYAQLADFLRAQLNRVYRNFDLTVNLGQLRTIQVFVVGQARHPGSYTISSLSTLLNALFVSGGPMQQGSLRDIQVLRNGKVIDHFDLYDLLLHGDKTHDLALQSGDVIFIPPVGRQVAVTGSVNSPAIYEIRPGTTASQLILLAGGETSVARSSQIRLERIFQQSMRDIIDVNLAGGQDPVLDNGDILTVGTILDRFRDVVTLRGNVSFPGRYVWHSGMRITDLVRDRDQLVTRNYYRRRNELGNPQPGNVPDSRGEGALQVGGLDKARTSDAAVQSGAANTSDKGGSSVGSALTSSSSVFSSQTDVVLSAPDVDLNYAVIERLDPVTLRTSLIPFNPGKLYIDGDQSQNLLLQSGDVVTFFSTADIKIPTSQQTRFVRLEGEFVASGVYSVQPGETLRQLIDRAGGFTPDAYLFGSEFTRLSTQRVQQQRLNEYADTLEAQVSTANANANAGAISDRDAIAAQAAAQEARETISRIRRIVPLGRIVLELKPDSRGVDAVPNITLEDGDRFIVPRVPSTVSVEGSVYSANAFIFQRGHREHDYLRQAGGPGRDADRKRIFILRADGSVFSRQYGNVDRATMFPGDTVVVPPQFNHHAVLRNVLDLSTIVGQFGLGAAAINVLR